MSNSVAKATVITLALLIATITLMTIEPQPSQAQLATTQPLSGPLPSGATVNITVQPSVFHSFRPNPIGVNQQLLVNVWLNPALNRDRFHPNYKITFTKPDGTNEVITLNSYVADSTAYLEYVPNQVGEWKIKFEFLGTYFPAGRYLNGYIVTNSSGQYLGSAYYQPASIEHTLTVQADMIASWPPAALPTDYWTRPVAVENREWWPILGNYPGDGYQGGGLLWDKLYPDTNPVYSPRYRFHPWVQGPESAHIVWKRQGAIGGMLGGPSGQFNTRSSTSNPSVIYAGRAYQTYAKPGVGNVAACYDLRTGEVYYEIPTASGGVTPTYVVYNSPTPSSIPGADATQAWSVELIAVSSGNLYKIDPYTGTTSKYSISPLTDGGTFVNQIGGEFLAVQDLGPAAGPAPSGGNAPYYDYLGTNWIITNPGNVRYRVIKWTTRGSSANFSARVLSNTTTEWTTGGVTDVTQWRTSIDFNTGIAVATPYPEDDSLGIWWKLEMHAIDIKTGKHLWSKIIPEERPYSGTAHVSDHGKVAILTQSGVFMAFDLRTGNLVWRSEQMDYPWGSASFGAYSISSAYGLIFRASYDGVYAFDWNTGKIVWKYVAPAEASFEAPYITNGQEHYNFNSHIIVADGKAYTWNSEHSESYPASRGWKLHCINATTGEKIWDIMLPGTVGAIADGYMTAANDRDGYMYVFGKGKSQTTIMASDKTTTKGTALMIEGTVLDLSPAQPNTPCVSKDSMALQMEYIHKQMPIDGIWGNETITGVPVTLTAISSYGSVIDVGTVTTNGYYGKFGKSWTPPNEGTYEIVASFAGDASYSSSADSTAISVGPAVEEIQIPEQIAPPDYTMTIIGVGITVIIAVVIAVAIVGILILRKK